MADLAKLKPSERIVEIHDPADEETKLGVTVSILSLDDPSMSRLKRKLLDRRLSLEAKGKHFKAEDIDDNTNEVLFTAMTGWTWGKDANGDEVTFNGSKPEFNRNNVFKVFEELPWFKEQIDRAVGDRKAFFATSNPN